MEDKKKKDMVDGLKVGDVLLIKGKKKLPNPIDENIKTLESMHKKTLESIRVA